MSTRVTDRPAAPIRVARPASVGRGGLWLFLAFASLYLLTSLGDQQSLDGRLMFETARALVERRTVALDPGIGGTPGRDGAEYSKFGPGQSLVEAPLVLVGEAAQVVRPRPDPRFWPSFFASLANGLVSAALVATLFGLGLSLGYGRRAALALAAVGGLASPIWPYAKADFSEPLQTLALLLAVWGLATWRGGGDRRWLVLAGSGAGLAVLTKLADLIWLAPLVLYGAWLLRERRRLGADGRALAGDLLAWGLPLALCLLAVGLFNWYRFGSPLASGYNPDDAPFQGPLYAGLYGLLFSSGKSLLLYTPPLLAAAGAWPAFARQRRAEAALILGLAGSTLLLYASYPVWHGGWCWGPRYLLPVVPLLLVPLAGLVERARAGWRSAARIFLVLCVLAGFWVQILGVAVDPRGLLSLLSPGGSDTRPYYLWLPPYSPLVVHPWLLQAAVQRGLLRDEAGAAARLNEPPWFQADIVDPAVPTPDLAFVSTVTTNYFWWQRLRLEAGSGVASGFGVALLLGFGLSLWRLRRAVAPLTRD